MDEDREWEDAAFNTRHLHNRNDRGGQSTRHQFQVRNTFGTHLLKCVALERLQEKDHVGRAAKSASASSKKMTNSSTGGSSSSSSSSSSSGGDVVLDIYRLTDGEEGILGALKCAGVLEANVVFAGSRKTLAKITRHLERLDSVQAPSPAPQPPGGSTAQTDQGSHENDLDESDDEDDSSEGDVEDGTTSREHRQRRRIATFEKNSFRQPKFWLRWQGAVQSGDGETTKVHGSGYVVFSANDCKRFQGTLTSEELGWNNVKMSGWKTRPQPERDFEIQWNREL